MLFFLKNGDTHLANTWNVKGNLKYEMNWSALVRHMGFESDLSEQIHTCSTRFHWQNESGKLVVSEFAGCKSILVS